MAIPLFRKAKIIFKNSTMSIRKSWREVKSEFSLIVRSNKHNKSHPDIFAIFSIIEQESNSKIFELQKDKFNKIKQDIIGDLNIPDSRVLDALRGLLHNNQFPKNDEVKIKISKFLHKKTKQIIDQNNQYEEGLIKVLLFEFPFLIGFNKYSIISSLIRNNSKNSNKIIKDVLLNIQMLEFLGDMKDVLKFINLSLTYCNKSAFMLFVRFLRQQDSLALLIQKSDLKTRILSSYIISRKGPDFGSIFISSMQNNDLSETNLRLVKSFLNAIKSMNCPDAIKYEKFRTIVKYLTLAKSIGNSNGKLTKLVNSYIKELNCDKKKIDDKSRIMNSGEVKKIKGVKPSTKIYSTRTVNIAKQSPENYWLMNNAAYLV